MSFEYVDADELQEALEHAIRRYARIHPDLEPVAFRAGDLAEHLIHDLGFDDLILDAVIARAELEELTDAAAGTFHGWTASEMSWSPNFAGDETRRLDAGDAVGRHEPRSAPSVSRRSASVNSNGNVDGGPRSAGRDEARHEPNVDDDDLTPLPDDLIDYLRQRKVAQLCPACARRPQQTRAGWCRICTHEIAAAARRDPTEGPPIDDDDQRV